MLQTVTITIYPGQRPRKWEIAELQKITVKWWREMGVGGTEETMWYNVNPHQPIVNGVCNAEQINQERCIFW